MPKRQLSWLDPADQPPVDVVLYSEPFVHGMNACAANDLKDMILAVAHVRLKHALG